MVAATIIFIKKLTVNFEVHEGKVTVIKKSHHYWKEGTEKLKKFTFLY